MNRDEALERLHVIDEEAKKLRESLKISGVGENIWHSDTMDDDEWIVEADGYGKATFSIVEGNYPNDYLTKFHLEFSSEGNALLFVDMVYDQEPDYDELRRVYKEDISEEDR